MKKSQIKILFLVLMFAALTLPLFAQGNDLVPAGMTNLFKQILDIFNGFIVRSILVMCLCGCAVAYGFNKDNEKMKRNVIAIGIAIVVLVIAGGVVDKIWSAAAS